jgi:tRNA threonylcarbamoyladenosine biosynthesis protein TsaE
MISKSLKETDKLAKEFIKNLLSNPATKLGAFVVAMEGDLGSGKTTFVKMIAKEFGIKNTVTSPTFVIEKIYKLENQDFDNLIHIDVYRLESGEELKTLGWEEISKNPKNIIFIEWSENVKDILPENKQEISFKFIDKNTREIMW